MNHNHKITIYNFRRILGCPSLIVVLGNHINMYVRINLIIITIICRGFVYCSVSVSELYLTASQQFDRCQHQGT